MSEQAPVESHQHDSDQIARAAQYDQPAPQTGARTDYWKAPTDDQIEKAAQYGFDLGARQKYYSSDEWARRNS